MARERITFPVNLRQNTNDDSTAFGKWFPVPSTSEPMSLKGFAKHLSEHGKLASYDMLVLVLQNIVGCMKELILQGQSVKLDGLGTFRPTIEGKGSNDVETAISLGPNVIIEGIHLRFSPENAKGEKLTSRALKNECAFEFKDVLIRKEKTVDVREDRSLRLRPLADRGHAWRPGLSFGRASALLTLCPFLWRREKN